MNLELRDDAQSSALRTEVLAKCLPPEPPNATARDWIGAGQPAARALLRGRRIGRNPPRRRDAGPARAGLSVTRRFGVQTSRERSSNLRSLRLQED